MKEIRCDFKGSFYITVKDNDTKEEIDKAVDNYLIYVERGVQDLAVIEEYSWEEDTL